MEFNSLIFIFKFCIVLGLINFVLGYPLVFAFRKFFNRDFKGWSQIFGISVLIITLCGFYYYGIFQYVKLFLKFLIIIAGFISALLVVSKKINQKIFDVISSELSPILLIIGLMVVLVLPQHFFPSYIPSYNVNHDAISIISLSKIIDKDNSFSSFCSQRKDIPPCNIVTTNYPLGYVFYLSFVKSIFSFFDYYVLAHLVNVFLYALSLIPLSKIMGLILKKKNKIFTLFSLLLGLSAYLPVQFLNQSFYSQNMLVFPLFSMVYLLGVFIERKKLSLAELLSFSLLMSVAIYIYSLTLFFWVLPLSLIIVLDLLFNRKITLKKVSKYILVICLVVGVLTSGFAYRSISFFYNYAFKNKGTESSFFEARGNTYGYSNISTPFSAWLDTDFRIDTAGKIRTYSYMVLFFQLIIFIYAFFIKKILKNKIVVIYLVGFVFPIIFSYFILRSPYYFNKTLFYASFLFLILILYSLLMVAGQRKSNILLRGISSIILIIFINNSYVSLNYFGKPPIDKFNSMIDTINYLDRNNINNVIAMDDEEWSRYFLVDKGDCNILSKTSPCKTDNVELVKDKYVIDRRGVYVFANNLESLISSNMLGRKEYKNNFYTVVSY